MASRIGNDHPQVLVLDEEVPFPTNTGKKTRTLNLLTVLARDFEIEMVVHKNNATEDALAALRSRGIGVQVAPSKIPSKAGLGFPFRLARSLFSTFPYSVTSHYRPEYRELMRTKVASGGFALVHCEWTPYARYREAHSVPWVVAAHNVEHLIWERLAKNERLLPKREFLKVQARRMRRFESQVFSTIPYATAVSEGDAQTLRGFGCRRVEVVPNGVDTEYFDVRREADREPRSLVFTGSMDWHANQDAIAWFAKNVHPLLLKEGPYRLYVVGRDPPSWMTQRGGLPPEIVVTGTVDDVRPYIARAIVYVVPLRAGGGSRLKILEALSMGMPVVSTTVGAEGLSVSNGTHIVLADEPANFAKEVQTLLADPSKRARLGMEGRQLVEARYDWAGIAGVQARFWQEAINGSLC